MSQSINRALLLACLLFSERPAIAQATGETDSPWLPAMEYQLIERSFARCLKASYQAQKVPLSNARIARAWSNDLDQYSGSLTVEDIRRAPQRSIDGTPFIRCSWFSEHVLAR